MCLTPQSTMRSATSMSIPGVRAWGLSSVGSHDVVVPRLVAALIWTAYMAAALLSHSLRESDI